jgi:Icc protein
MAGGRWRRDEFAFDTAASLRRVVAAVRRLDPPPAFAVLGGDLVSPDLIDRTRTLASDEYDPSYALLKEILAELPCPIHPMMGNHDDRAAFNRVLRAAPPDAPCYESFDHAGYHFVTLDSHVPGRVDGALDPAQLAWLAADLARHRERPALVFVHHHPWPLGIRWLDELSLQNGAALMTALAKGGQVRWVVAGHVHLDQTVERDGLAMLTTPSTCVQFSKTSQERKMLPGPPAFRIVDVVDGALATRVLHLREGDEL